METGTENCYLETGPQPGRYLCDKFQPYIPCSPKSIEHIQKERHNSNFRDNSVYLQFPTAILQLNYFKSGPVTRWIRNNK